MILYIPSIMAASLIEKLESLAGSRWLHRSAEEPPLHEVVTDLHGDCWLELDTAASMTLSPTADLGGVARLMQPWLADGLMPADTLTNLLALLEARRGEFLFVHEALPQVFKDLAKTRQQMMDAGLLGRRGAPERTREAEAMVTLTLLTAL
jgi:hypothetical protein